MEVCVVALRYLAIAGLGLLAFMRIPRYSWSADVTQRCKHLDRKQLNRLHRSTRSHPRGPLDSDIYKPSVCHTNSMKRHTDRQALVKGEYEPSMSTKSADVLLSVPSLSPMPYSIVLVCNDDVSVSAIKTLSMEKLFSGSIPYALVSTHCGSMRL